MSILYAPVGITPTKPLTPSHIKGLLFFDCIQRLESLRSAGVVWHNRRPWDISLQTLRFWAYLDATLPGQDYSQLGEADIGQQYMQCFQSGPTPAPRELEHYIQRIESEGYVHPSSVRILGLWQHVFEWLGLNKAVLVHSEPFAESQQDVLARLAKLGLLLDQRRCGGPVFLDLTDHGHALRSLVSEHGLPNYLMAILRDVWARAAHHTEVCLYHDIGVERDYLLLERLLKLSGITARRIAFNRVAVDGKVLSARQGGWHHFTATEILQRVAKDYSPAEIRLGFLLYFLFESGIKRPKNYSDDELAQALRKARDILLALPAGEACERSVLAAAVRTKQGVNVYGCLSLLQQRRVDNSLKRGILECLL
ncbi:MAG: hypothetical protein Q8J78_03115 [Moraxellaceae bacterium]|nr:hypothetical protein [Moraxellaceae bacterium]